MPRRTRLARIVSRLLLGVTLLSIPGCTPPHRGPTIKLAELATFGEAATTMCYVHGADDVVLVDPRIVQVRELWAVTGNVRSSGIASPLHHRVKVEAVDEDESLVLATLSPVRTVDGDEWTFHLPIPAPAVFDHLHLAVVSAEDAFQTLPPHAR
jgi:hypothetical protein